MNICEQLLKQDAGKIEMPKKNFKIKLKKMSGIELEFPLVAIESEVMSEIQENAVNINEDGTTNINTYDLKVMSIIEGCPDVFKNKDLMKHYNCATPVDLVNLLLLSGEQEVLAKEIQDLSGYDKEQKEDKKKKLRDKYIEM